MIVYYMGIKYGHGYTSATHMTKVFVKGTILFLQCIRSCKLPCTISNKRCKITGMQADIISPNDDREAPLCVVH